MQQALEIQFGTETEIGITRQDPADLDVVAESIALVRSAAAPGVRMRWDYDCEDPHCDARGFHAEELRQDTDEANYFAQDAQRELSFHEIKSDLVLRNGARFYNDHAHPEYCTPECSTLRELLQQEHAGQSLLMDCAHAVNAKTRNPVLLYKNNTDFSGHSYGCHENYLMPRRVPWGTLSEAMMAFFVTRQIYCGTGKFGWEDEDRFLGPGFQIAQRSDFFRELQSVDTMQRRPIINTRDEPHADSQRFRRFHVIVGDTNLSPYATWLKIGTTALVLQALLNGAPLDRIPKVADPLGAIRSISRDRSWQWGCALTGGRNSDAVAIQRAYVRMVRDFCPSLLSEWIAVIEGWETVLEDLERDPLSTADRLDWAAKFKLIDEFRRSEKLKDDNPWLRSLDLSYHLLDRKQGLFFGLLEQGAFRLPLPLEEIQHPTLCPPPTTRAAVRGRCIEKFGAAVESTQWECVSLRSRHGTIQLDLRSLFDPHDVRQSLKILGAAQTVEDLLQLPFAKLV